MSLNITISPMMLYNGYLNVAGLFFSINRWPSQANPYPKTGNSNNIAHLWVIITRIKINKARRKPEK